MGRVFARRGGRRVEPPDPLLAYTWAVHRSPAAGRRCLGRRLRAIGLPALLLVGAVVAGCGGSPSSAKETGKGKPSAARAVAVTVARVEARPVERMVPTDGSIGTLAAL